MPEDRKKKKTSKYDYIKTKNFSMKRDIMNNV